MSFISGFLVVCAAVAGFAGLATLSEATTGVGFIALGCLAAIFARIAQAAALHRPPAETAAQRGARLAADAGASERP